MKRILFALVIMTNWFSMAQDKILDWSVKHPESGEWMQLGTRGSVQEVFIKNGLEPDPFYGLNEKKFAWFENQIWEFKAEFYLSAEDADFAFNELYFSSIDTYADIFLNDSLIGHAKNAFIPHSFQVKTYIQKGKNEVRLRFTPPILYHGDNYKNALYHLPAPNDVHDTAIAPYTRKPQYQFGWDWSLRMNTIGLNDEVKLLSYNHNRIINRNVSTLSVTEGDAEIVMSLFLANETNEPLIWESELFGNETLVAENGILSRKLSITNVELWWPKGFGKQHLYSDKILLKTIDNKIVDSINIKFGVKQSELVMEADQWGTSYYFKVNGIPVFCKGANYIPQDVFPSSISDSAVREMVQIMAESNFNMVRVWGGGFYQKEAFYDECDRLGIMVWQDLMFACSMYPGNEAFLNNVRDELNYQIPRIGSHTSVMLFNGNNEVEVAWGNWGFQIKYGLYGKEAREIEKAYNDLFKVMAPETVKRYTTIPYVHTSPLSNWGKTELYNHGSQHYWGVWHGKDPMEDFGKKVGRFNAEYGFQSFPEFNTLRSFSDTVDWDIKSEVMKQHQKSYVGNDMILRHAKRLYGSPENFREFVYFSQLTQAKAVSMAIAGHRVDAPRCGGTLYWQLNDCWPVSSWSSIDYYGNHKALQYSAKLDYNDIAVVRKYEDLECSNFYLVSSSPQSSKVELKCQVFDLRGHLRKELEVDTTISNLQSFKIELEQEKRRLFRRKKRKNSYYLFSWKVDGKSFQRSFISYEGGDKAEKGKVKLHVLNVDEMNKTAILQISNKEFVADLWICSSKFGVRYSENFKSYLPGVHQIEIRFKDLPEINDFELFWR